MQSSRKKYERIRPIIYFLFTAQSLVVSGQPYVNTQMLFDYNVVYPFANVWTADAEASYQTLVSNGDKWRSLQFTPTIQRNMGRRVDLSAATPVYYTVQSSDKVTLETRFSPAARFIYTSNRRVESRSVLRYDFRSVKTTGGDWQFSNRARLSLEFIIAINRPNVYLDGLVYGIIDGEAFFVMDQNINERFANMRKARAGVGYRLNYRHRFELLYQVQKSRTTLDQPFDTRDNIIRMRYIMVLNPPRASSPNSD